ncbi:hypothetical protein ZIOFF_040469 [Zingiber officinale]|uniref:Uncharacterized protein n=1 Tax=Zingiber officinale TaxID=94328 RepID=A0A8J5L4J7_ZINOF|nr:hypothetical protein ZIOFF_040469 [Zingiber officinale]
MLGTDLSHWTHNPILRIQDKVTARRAVYHYDRFLFEGTPGNISSGDGVGPVAQRIRAHGYEPRCRGFESLLAHNLPFWEGPFPLVGVGKS